MVLVKMDRVKRNQLYGAFVVFLFLLMPFGVYSQVSALDSVNQSLYSDNPNVSTLLEYMAAQTYKDDTNTLAIANAGLTFARENNMPEWEVEFLIGRSRAYKFQKDYSQVFLDALTAVQLVDEYQMGPKWRSRANFLVAFALQEMGALNEAIEVRKGQLPWAEVHGTTGRYMNHLKAIGGMYYRMEKFDSAIIYFKKAHVYAQGKGNREGEASALNNLGLAYSKQEKLDSSKFFFEKSYALFKLGETYTDSLMRGLVGGNLSQCYSPDENKSIIIELLNSEIEVTKKLNSQFTLPEAYSRMSALYSSLKEYDAALAYMDSAFQLVTQQAKIGTPNRIHLNVIDNYIDLQQKVGNTSAALKLAMEYIKVNEHLFGEEAQKSLTSSKVSYQVSSMEHELELKKALVAKLKKEEEFSSQKTWLIVVIGLLLILVAVGVIFQMRKDQKQSKLIEEYSKQILEKTIESKNQKLTQAMLNVTRKKEFLQELVKRLSEGKSKKIDTSIQLFISNEIKMDEALLEMDKYISQLDEEFFTKLEFKYPQLTPSDLKLCGLIRMELSNKELAIIMNITTDSMKTRKTRLSKKMNLAPGTKLIEVLKNI